MKIEKTNEEITYTISEEIHFTPKCIGSITVNITNGKVLYIANQAGKGEFNFIDSKPEVVAAVGRMLIAASELVKGEKNV